MGGSEWVYRQPYAGSLPQTLRALQQRVLDSGDFLWVDDLYGAESEASVDEVVDMAEGRLARPTTLAQLGAAKRQGGWFWQTGTHSILDMHAVVDPARPDTPPLGLEAGVIHPLGDDEVQQLLAHGPATRADLDLVSGGETRSGLDRLSGPSWTGRCLVAVDDGHPVEVLFWGYSGD